MRELTLIERFINWLRSLFISKEKIKENSDEIKREMCRKAVQGGLCPHHDCDTCAWSTNKGEIANDYRTSYKDTEIRRNG